MTSSRAFTLIELLIVVAIVAILAAIAVPNFLEAQIRAKVGRAVSDMRTIAGAVEAYCVDHGKYPPNSADGFGVVPANLSTPVAYVTVAYMTDPFNSEITNQRPILTRFYTYHKILTSKDLIEIYRAKGPPQPGEATMTYNPRAFWKYGKWRMVSNGPDGVYGSNLRNIDIPYDASNGTRSYGNIFRLQNGQPFPRD